MNSYLTIHDRAGIFAVIVAIIATLLGVIGFYYYAASMAPTPVKVPAPIPSMQETAPTMKPA